MTANELTKAILTVMQATPGCKAWRQNNHATRGRINNATKGVPDILACYRGQFTGVEVKVDKDKLSDAQIAFADELQRCGGVYFVAKTLDDFLVFWKEKTPTTRAGAIHENQHN